MVSATTTLDVLRSNGAGAIADQIIKNFVGDWNTKDWGECEIRANGEFSANGRHGYLAWNLNDPTRVQLCSKHCRDPNSYYLRHDTDSDGDRVLIMFKTHNDGKEETWTDNT